jgi:SAM-dependent methyltransferase
MDDVVRPYATAIRRPSGGSAPARKLLPLIAEAPAVRSILDYGCGYGSDVGFYRANGYHAIGYDCYPPFGYSERPTQQFDLVTLVYVMNVVPSRAGRLAVLRDAAGFLAPTGLLFVVSRSAEEILSRARAKRWLAHSDGFWSNQSKGMFQHGLDESEILELCGEVGLGIHPPVARFLSMRDTTAVLVRRLNDAALDI